MSEVEQFPTLPSQPFRLDVPLHELLQQPSREAIPRAPALRQAALPTAVFPQHPELFHDLDEQDIAAHEAVLRSGKCDRTTSNTCMRTIPTSARRTFPWSMTYWTGSSTSSVRAGRWSTPFLACRT